MPDGQWYPVAAGVVAIVLLRWLSRRPRAARRRRAPRAGPGEVWFAMVPFENGTGAKDRPVLILSAEAHSLEVARFTSRSRDARQDYVRVPDGLPGLPRESWISLRPLRLPRSRLRRRIGAPGEAFVDWYWRTVDER